MTSFRVVVREADGLTATVSTGADRIGPELGYPVRAVSGPSGGYAIGAGARLPPLQLDDDSAAAVALGVRAAASGAVAGMEEAALRALAATEQVMPAHPRRRVTGLRWSVVALPAGGPAVESSVLALLALACRDGERPRFGHVDRTPPVRR
ncbi:MAG: hypothetical protein J2P19_21535, partial [Pseudonocardia sp.]|nr:hypothetical protein [Pseudonocardia sp.]